MKLKNFSIWFIAAAFLLNSCASTKYSGPVEPIMIDPNAPVHTGGQNPKELQVEEKLIEASKMQMLGDFQQAINLYKECIKLDPQNDAAYFNIAKIYFEQQRFIDALENIREAVKINPDNEWYQNLYGTLLGGTGNFKEAIRVYQQMVEINPDNLDAWFNYAYFLEQSNQPEEAISVLDEIEERFGINPDISQQKAQMWMKQGKVDKAADEMERLIEAYPEESRFYTQLVDLYMNNGMEEKGFEVLQRLTKIDPNNPDALLILADHYRKSGEPDKAFDMLKQAFNNPSLSVDVKISILLSYFPALLMDEKAKPEAKELSELLVKMHPNEAKAWAVTGDFYNQVDDWQMALENYKKSIALDQSKFSVWQQVFYLYSSYDKMDSLRVVTERAKELFPDQSLVYYFNGYANLHTMHYQEAVNSFGKAIQIGTDDKKMMVQMYTNMGDAYNYLKKFSPADSCFELALIFNPESAYALNNYAYSLSVRGERLENAKKMIDKAVKLDPEVAAYEDTYAWVLYRMGNFADAKTWQERALNHGGDKDGTVLEHYGDILYQLGDVNGAVEYWMKAKEKNVESSTIDKKIADRKLYE